MKGKHTHFSILFIIALLMCNALQAAINDRYTLVTSADELADGDEFIIVDNEYKQTVGQYEVLATTSRFEGCPIKLEEEYAIISDAKTSIFTLKKVDEVSYIKFKKDGKYYYISSGNDKTGSIQLLDNIENSTNRDLCKTTFDFDSKNNKANVNITIGTKKYKNFWCNTSKGTYIWKIHDTATSSDIYIYKKASSATTTDITLDGLNADAKNVDVLKDYEGKTVDKITINRSFTADGGWYTLCLPFALTAKDISETFNGALFNEFESVSVNDQGVAQLKFKKVTETQAGVPYMVLPRNTVEAPMFTDKTIKETTPKTITRTCKASDGEQLSYQFVGVYDPTVVSSENNVRFVGGNQGTELLIPDGKGTMKGLRAYFVFPNNTNGNITLAKLNVEDDSTTGINTVLRPEANVTDANSSAIYTLSGQKVQKKNNSLIPGMYIQNGKKFIVK